ncbi:Methionine/alanine import family NSS transporter small subunit [Pseudomonas sp. IT-P218]
MSLAMTIVMLISGWLAVAAAMLWGVLRITRRHHHPAPPVPLTETDKGAAQHATVH